jgi:hypothetical protein
MYNDRDGGRSPRHITQLMIQLVGGNDRIKDIRGRFPDYICMVMFIGGAGQPIAIYPRDAQTWGRLRLRTAAPAPKYA